MTDTKRPKGLSIQCELETIARRVQKNYPTLAKDEKVICDCCNAVIHQTLKHGGAIIRRDMNTVPEIMCLTCFSAGDVPENWVVSIPDWEITFWEFVVQVRERLGFKAQSKL